MNVYVVTDFVGVNDDILNMAHRDIPLLFLKTLMEDGVVREFRVNGEQCFRYNRFLVYCYLVLNNMIGDVNEDY